MLFLVTVKWWLKDAGIRKRVTGTDSFKSNEILTEFDVMDMLDDLCGGSEEQWRENREKFPNFDREHIQSIEPQTWGIYKFKVEALEEGKVERT